MARTLSSSSQRVRQRYVKSIRLLGEALLNFESQYGDIFTFILLGRKITVYLGAKGNDFILNGKHRDMNAEGMFGPRSSPKMLRSLTSMLVQRYIAFSLLPSLERV